MIIEGIVTTRNADGSSNIAPMGPVVDPALTRFLLRPFQTSTTFRNLRERPGAVFHVVDDVLLLARAALNRLERPPSIEPAVVVAGDVLQSACRWYELEVERIDASQPRSEIEMRVVHAGRLREFWGWNRAKHAVLEAAILATRVHLISGDELRRELERLRVPVEKTSGADEAAAFELVREYIMESLATGRGAGGG